MPVWSPDGRRIAFSAGGGFYVARADGAGRVRVARSRYTSNVPTVSWSPDGKRLAYVACSAEFLSQSCEHSTAFDVYVSPVSGGRRQRITTKSGFPQCPVWSRRGRLAFYEDGIGVVQPDGRIRVYSGSGCPSWSPDGRRFAAVAAGGIVVRNADGSGGRVIRLPVAKAPASYPRWSHDGRRLAVVVVGSGSGPRQVYTARADGTAFRRIALPRR